MMEGRNAVPGECQVSLGVALGSVQGSLDFKKRAVGKGPQEWDEEVA